MLTCTLVPKIVNKCDSFSGLQQMENVQFSPFERNNYLGTAFEERKFALLRFTYLIFYEHPFLQH